MPEEYGDDRLVFELHADDHIELANLGEGLAGLARHYQRYLEERGIDPAAAPSKLFVTNVKSGSVEFELAMLVKFYTWARRVRTDL